MLINSAIQIGTETGVSIGPIGMMGSNLIVIILVQDLGGTPSGPPSDGINTYTELTGFDDINGFIRLRRYYKKDPIVGAPLTFTYSGTGIYSPMAVYGFSDVKNSPADAENSGSIAITTSLQTGSITPSEPSEILIPALGFEGSISALSINSGFANPLFVDYTGGVSFGLATSYQLQNGSSAVNPKFSWTNNTTTSVAAINSFKQNYINPIGLLGQGLL